MSADILIPCGGIDRDKPEILFSALQKILDASSDLMFVKDMNLTYVAGTQSFAEMVGKASMSEVLGRTDYEIFEDKEFSKRYTADDRKLLDGGKDLLDYVEPLTDKDGEARYSSTSKYILTDGTGAQIGLLGISKDITREIKAGQQYKQVIDYLFTLPEDTHAAILIDVTDWRIVAQRRQEADKAHFPLFDTMDAFVSTALQGISDTESDAYALYRQISQKYLRDIFSQGKNEFEVEYQRRITEDMIRWAREEWKLMSDPKNGHLTAMVLVRDINSKKQAEEVLAQAATTDALTGLLNRTAAQTEILSYLEGDGADGSHAVFMIDMDDFKQVNDTYGHQAGDLLLIELARGIKSCFRETDIVCRLGGDEFFVFAKNMPDQDAIRKRTERLLEVAHTVYSGQTMATGSISIGVSTYPADGKTLDELYGKADEALYRAKGMGKAQAAFSSAGQSLWYSNAFAKRYEAYNSQVVEHSNSICYITDMDTYELLHLTKAGMAVHGMTRPEEYLGKKCHKVIMGLDEPCPFCPNSKLREDREYRWERYNENIDKWFDRTSTIIHLDGRRCHLEIARDITARKEELSLLSGQLTMEDVLFRCLHTLTSEKDMNTALNLFLEAIGGYYQANRAYIFEFDLENGLLDNTFEWCAPGVTAEIDKLQRLPLEVVSGWIKKFETDGEFSISSLGNDVDPDSEEYRILEMQGIESLLAAPLLRDGTIIGFIGVDDPRQKQGNLVLLRSVTEFVQAELERRKLMAELEYMSFTDSLTGLKNRNQYARMLREYDRRTPDSLGVVFLDINGMKGINDFHGQSYGDHVIKKTGRIMAEHLSGTVFRTGGDEFVALYEDIGKEEFQHEVLALRDVFAAERECNVSIGCAWREQEENIQSLLLQAGELLAAEKQSYYHSVLKEGRETGYTSFSSEVVSEIEEGRFLVYYQPQVDIKTGRITGAEALVRKRSDDGSLIPPNKFVPFYEMEGVISHVDLFVLKSACATMREWMEQGYDLHLSVNFSRVTLLEPGIVDTIRTICQQHEVSPSRITIEVTESISKMDHDLLKDLIQSINNAGFTISLDDFGSQYSNLAILAAMDFDEIKFDKSLVDALEHNQKSRVVMQNSVRMCRDLEGTSSLAEGIETKGQLDLLVDYQCDFGQGYYFSRPVPPEEFSDLLNGNRETRPNN